LSLKSALDLIDQAMRAAAHAHAHGIVHRNIQPATLLIGRQGAEDVVKLIGFGLARDAGPYLGYIPTIRQIHFPIPFSSPEIISDERNTTPLSDQYALAATLYFLLTGACVLEFPNNNYVEGLRMALEGKRVPVSQRRPDLPAGLVAVIHRALELKPEKRYPDVESLRQALRPFRTEPVAP
jgi:serine/threonine-protein kinase